MKGETDHLLHPAPNLSIVLITTLTALTFGQQRTIKYSYQAALGHLLAFIRAYHLEDDHKNYLSYCVGL
jgi:hypothetical protein